MLASRPLISGSRIVTFSISPLMLWEISTGVESLMVGDRIGADILGAKNARLKAALVKTGEFRESDLESPIVVPDYIFDSVLDVGKLFP